MALMHTPQPELGLLCPSFSLPGVDGKTHTNQEFAGQAMLVLFICNHCPYVKAIEDRLITLGQDLEKLGVAMLGVCSNDGQKYPDDSFENMRKRSQEKNYSFLYLHDESQSVAKAFDAVCTPDFFLYDKNHKLYYRGRLDDNWKEPSLVTKRELYQAAKDCVAGKAPSTEQLSSMGCSIKWKA